MKLSFVSNIILNKKTISIKNRHAWTLTDKSFLNWKYCIPDVTRNVSKMTWFAKSTLRCANEQWRGEKRSKKNKTWDNLRTKFDIIYHKSFKIKEALLNIISTKKKIKWSRSYVEIWKYDIATHEKVSFVSLKNKHQKGYLNKSSEHRPCKF